MRINHNMITETKSQSPPPHLRSHLDHISNHLNLLLVSSFYIHRVSSVIHLLRSTPCTICHHKATSTIYRHNALYDLPSQGYIYNYRHNTFSDLTIDVVSIYHQCLESLNTTNVPYLNFFDNLFQKT